MFKSVVKSILLFLLAINLLVSSLFVSWQFNRSTDYFYPFFYEQLDMAGHIDFHGPRNKTKVDYHTVGMAEHVRVFSELVSMVHGHGIGLAELKYYAKSGEPIDTVLTQEEVAHMQEVASLTTIVTWLGAFSFLLSLLIIFLSWRKKITWPSFGKMSLLTVGGSLALLGVLAAIGFGRVFYQFHVAAFSEAPWMFSYHESLLVVLTRSPEYFGVMAACIALPALLLFLLLMWFLCRQKTDNKT